MSELHNESKDIVAEGHKISIDPMAETALQT